MQRTITRLILAISYLLVTNTSVFADSFPRDTTYTPYQAWKNIRKNYPDTKIVNPYLSPTVREDRNVVYTTLADTPYGKRELHLDIFRPVKPGKYPALLMIHGGGWVSGNKSMEIPMAQRIADAGFVTIPVEYRLAPEAVYPAAIHDIKAAIRWVKANADKYSIDTTRIAIEGNSAGGQLATLVGMTNQIARFEGNEGNTEHSSTVQAVIDIDGVVDFLAPSSLNLVRTPTTCDIVWLGGSFIQKPEIWKEASPIFWVNEKSVPVSFIESAQPRFHSGRDEMIDMMNQNKIYTEVHTLPDTPHTFWLYDPWFKPTVNYVIIFLDKVFKPTNK